ncbi:Uncharacterised protein [Zhongshania aliphaticivorans]|uniref:Uncharacterized protein n=1 Tax=Zhongshania aliphaticivorans TaxID=1470434 RepID=A0A5S9N7L7_9GAMM|nr:hypothetical protein [Zhongshania aliphaticivorans]CAA0080090.1 Uncharacterised protein [Zhongshania aliphaticivorans]CAA0085847.1 Uncharacterised protein [Zhongshania aliphaticivorans]
MTLLVAWAGIDSRGPASVYIATDSRVSWGSKGHFDHANKTFALQKFPAIIGYCGDSMASLMLISQAITLMEAVPESHGQNLENLVDVLIRFAVRNYSQYPAELSSGSFTVVICGKSRTESAGEFACYQVDSTFDKTTKKFLKLPEQSGPIVVAGSGASEFGDRYERHQSVENPNKSTSRDVFHVFNQTISNTAIYSVGNIPQITTVIRKPYSGGAHCGVVVNSQRYIAGQLIDKDIAPKELQWFNDNFEITNPQTKRRQDGAQAQPQFRC